jgi:hypothetical protein
MNAGSYRADLDSEKFRNVFVFHFLVAQENEQFAVGFRELRQGALKQRLLLVFLELTARGKYGCRDIDAIYLCRIRRVFFEVIDPGVPRDLIHPRDEPIRFPIGRPILQNSNEHFLHEIFADRTTSGKPTEKVVQRLTIAREENFELIDVAFTHGNHEVLVTGVVHRHHG